MTPLSEILNFGPYMIKIMHAIGIYTKEDLLKTDYLTIEKKLIAEGITPNILIFYSIEMGLQGRKWDAISTEEKRELRAVLKRDGTRKN